MLKATVVNSENSRVIIMDSITKVTPEEAGANIISASHGGVSSGEFALEVSLSSVFFNDAGVGKHGAGIPHSPCSGPAELLPGQLAHESAKIGGRQDMWDHGVIGDANSHAIRRWFLPGLPLKDALCASVAMTQR